MYIMLNAYGNIKNNLLKIRRVTKKTLDKIEECWILYSLIYFSFLHQKLKKPTHFSSTSDGPHEKNKFQKWPGQMDDGLRQDFNIF